MALCISDITMPTVLILAKKKVLSIYNYSSGQNTHDVGLPYTLTIVPCLTNTENLPYVPPIFTFKPISAIPELLSL